MVIEENFVQEQTFSCAVFAHDCYDADWARKGFNEGDCLFGYFELVGLEFYEGDWLGLGHCGGVHGPIQISL